MKNVIKKLSLLPLFMFVFTGTAFPQTIFFQEQFESGVPPAGWTVVDNEGTGVKWTTIAGSGEAGNFTNGSGEAACVSSDIFGLAEFDTELRTPILDFTNVAGATLSFTASYQNFGSLDFFDVDVSTDGGTNWTNIISWHEDHGDFRATPGEDVSLSISDLVAGQNNVVIRFHFYDPNLLDWDWYVQVDDLSIIPAITIQKAGAGSGTITSTPAGIDCGGTCSADFADGSEVTLTATPDLGSAFDGFSGGGCLGNGECTILFDQGAIVTATFNLDGDSDGISDLREEAGPNGGDGNQDGILDSLQANVATFPSITGSYVTLISETGTVLANVVATVNPSCADAPGECTYPQGFFGFTVKGLTPGAATTVQVILHEKDTTISTYYKYGPTPDYHANHWYPFLSAGQPGAAITQEATQTTILLSFIDGQRGDDDLSANGEITDVGAPAERTGGNGGCFIATAAYGSSMERHVIILREFRDRFLLTNSAGRTFVDLYNTYSPPVADALSNHNTLRSMVRWGLLPLVGMSWVILTLGPLATMALVMCFFMGLMGITGLRRWKKRR